MSRISGRTKRFLLFGSTLGCDSKWIETPLAPTDLYLQPQGLGRNEALRMNLATMAEHIKTLQVDRTRSFMALHFRFKTQ